MDLYLTGTPDAMRAVLDALCSLPNPPASVRWVLRAWPGRVEIVEGSRSTVAATWERAVANHLAAPGAVRVVSC